jgi:hypothetical protein
MLRGRGIDSASFNSPPLVKALNVLQVVQFRVLTIHVNTCNSTPLFWVWLRTGTNYIPSALTQRRTHQAMLAAIIILSLLSLLVATEADNSDVPSSPEPSEPLRPKSDTRNTENSEKSNRLAA